jgi:alcohol dehydrogenase class IV
MDVPPFVYDALPMRVRFGTGALAALPAELEALGGRQHQHPGEPEQRPLAARVAALLGQRAAGIHAEAVMHVPVAVAEAARVAAAQLGADGCVAVGGGSTIGLGKAVALTAGLPVVAVPTTYAGSEMTPIWGLTEAGVKRTGRDRKVLPRAVVYDPELTLTLPPGLSATSGMNAIAHGVEALYARDGNPITALMAEEGIRALAAGLPAIVARPADLAARTSALYGAWLCGACLGAVGMALHHKLCHTLGGSFDLPHAETHTVILPHAVAYNAPAAPAAMARVARALGVADAAAGLLALARRLGAPASLAALGLPESALDRAAELATASAYDNPRPVTREAVRRLLDDAFHGRAPAAAGA